MTVYFVSPVERRDIIKVGVTSDLDRRLLTLGAQVEGGIELLAQLEGGQEIETFIGELLAADWVEGEWFKRSALSDRMIEVFAGGVVGRRVWGRLRAVEGEKSAAAEDRDIARDLLKSVVARIGVLPLGKALSRAHTVLHGINPMWSRRRVQALWAREASRVDHYEIRDLEAAAALPNEAFHRPQIDGLGIVDCRVDRAGIEAGE